jgi:hypothetical protein
MSEENNILSELQAMGSPLAEMPRELPYRVPDNYFEEAGERMIHFVSAPLEVKGALPYSVPAGYFDALPEKVLAASKQEAGTKKTASFVPRMQWAAAAALAIVISIGGYITFSGQAANEPERMLASVPASEIQAYVENRYGTGEMRGAGDTKLTTLQLNRQEIESYLNDNGWE